MLTTLLLFMAIVSHQAPDLDQLHWQNRIVLLFADSAEDAQLHRQEQAFDQVAQELDERDMKVFAITGSADSAKQLRKRTGAPATGFAVILVGKDGSSKLRHTSPIEPAQLFATVDSMPMRRAEKRNQHP